MGLQSGGVALRRLSSIASKNYFPTAGNAPATPRPAGVDLRRLSSICIRNDNKNEILETINDSVLRDPSSANDKAVLQDVDSLTATCRKRIESLVPGVSNDASSTASRPRELKPGCIHGRRFHCKQCNACPHGKASAARCLDCGGASLCTHGRVRSGCKDCGGSSVCIHGRIKYVCKDCGGSSLCTHGRVKNMCKQCGGSSICTHGKYRWRCKECGGSALCTHGKDRSTCRECGGRAFC